MDVDDLASISFSRFPIAHHADDVFRVLLRSIKHVFFFSLTFDRLTSSERFFDI